MDGNIDLSGAMQDYLEAILKIEESLSIVRVTDIANELKIAKASVNQTLTKLKKLGLVNQQTYGPVLLTEEGRIIALKVKSRHTKLRQFLIGVLKVDPKIAEEDACKMEHVISSQTMKKLTEFLCTNGYLNDGCDKIKK